MGTPGGIFDGREDPLLGDGYLTWRPAAQHR